MAKRSREHRQDTPGYNDGRPTREERKQQHRAVRHSTHQVLHMAEDPDGVVVPEVRGAGDNHNHLAEPQDSKPRRFRVWKTKFWKRREGYHEMKSELDSNWPVITPNQLEDQV
ncbi:MAG TPA: hypothetical protein VFP67_11605 [Acidimicrobiia bacterium]|nr:hypothetical protein [Acidimicrobiia bacterium]